MITEFDVFVAFKQAEKEITGKGYRITKNWESYSKRSISSTDMAYLARIKDFFNTKWLNVKPIDYMKAGWEVYKLSNKKRCPECDVILYKPNKKFFECMECGYDLRKGFILNKILRPKILKHYIEKDKRAKRNLTPSQKRIDESFDFIIRYMGDTELPKGYNMLQSYCKLKVKGEGKRIIGDYLQNNIDTMTFVYCLYYKYVKLTDIEKESCYNIVNRYREVVQKMFEVEEYIKSKEE